MQITDAMVAKACAAYRDSAKDGSNPTLTEMRAALEAALAAMWRPTHRHKKRGFTYTVIGQAEVQCSDGLTDYEVVTVYRAADGCLWVRRKAEFEDGRFEELPSPPVKE